MALGPIQSPAFNTIPTTPAPAPAPAPMSPAAPVGNTPAAPFSNALAAPIPAQTFSNLTPSPAGSGSNFAMPVSNVSPVASWGNPLPPFAGAVPKFTVPTSSDQLAGFSGAQLEPLAQAGMFVLKSDAEKAEAKAKTAAVALTPEKTASDPNVMTKQEYENDKLRSEINALKKPPEEKKKGGGFLANLVGGPGMWLGNAIS